MAQTGFTPIQIYSSSTAAAAPTAGNLTNSTLGSELAINITDGKLFYKDNANAVQVIAWKVTPTTAGGTGLTSYAAGDLLYYATGTTLSKLAIGASKTILTSSGTAPQWSVSLDTTQGGTGLTSYTQGDLLYYDTGTTLTKLAKNTSATRYLSNTGTNNNPTWAQVNLANGVTGTLPTGNGGTNLTSFTANGIVYASSTSALATNANLTYDGANVTLTGGNFVIGTAGKGIDFSIDPSAPGMTSELLDDYEEGTFTPTISGSTSAGAGTYSVQEGRYTKVGNLVYVTAVMTWSAHTGTGNMRLSGLPFTVLNVVGLEPPLSLQVNDVALTALNVALATFRRNATYAEVLQTPVGGGPLTDVPIDTAASIRYAGSFLVA